MFFSWYLEIFNYFPLWVVPYHIPQPYPWINPSLLEGVDDTLFFDCAIYGFHQTGSTNYYRLLEKELVELHGIKTLISHNYYEEEEFWRSFNKSEYNAMKQRCRSQKHFSRPIS